MTHVEKEAIRTMYLSPAFYIRCGGGRGPHRL